ncbi:MAG: DUF3256 family protein [Bacteroidales bacterium]|nr:DUF3256 family protein [Bacteroidales bacterium]
MMKKVLMTLIVAVAMTVAPAQTLSEMLLHFSDKEMEVPMSVRQKMMDNKGNTIPLYDQYKLNIYDKRARFLRITTPLEVTYEICAWKLGKKEFLVALCETRCGNSCGSKIRFFLPHEDWREIPANEYIPEFTLEDIFDSKKLEKNYYTTQTIIKDFEVKTQFLLPQTGNDIVVIFTCLDELEKPEYQRIYKYLRGAMVDLIWENGSFKKSDPYFSY